MKFKEINRDRYLSNTPVKKWSTAIALSITSLSVAYAAYF